MEAVMIRTGSISAQSPAVPGSPRVSLSRNDSLSSVFSGPRSTVGSPRISLHLDVNHRRDKMIRRARSESDILRSENDFAAKSPAFPAEKQRFPGGDRGVNALSTVDEGEQKKLGDYYQEMLKSNPDDPLLLRNYGKFLHEVEKDVAGAEECYCRAILASPGDGDLLSLYAKLIWETHRDEERAKSYFDQAVSASPEILSDHLHEALQDLNTAIKSQPRLFLGANSNQATNMLALAAAHATQKQGVSLSSVKTDSSDCSTGKTRGQPSSQGSRRGNS